MISKTETNYSQVRSDRALCVVHPLLPSELETFIQAHVARLPARVNSLYGDYLPTFCNDGKPLLSTRALPRLARASVRRLFSFPPNHFQKQAVKRFLTKHKIDVVLAEHGQTGVEMMDVCQEANIPLVVHFHGFDAFDQRVVEVFEKRYLRLFGVASAIVAASQSMRTRLLELGAPAEKISVNPYGVNISLFSGADPTTAPPTFVAVGRFVDKKAPHLTLLSFKSVLEKCREARLVMIGEGELLEACKLMAKALGISTSVEFLGNRAPSEIAPRLRNARAFVQHSLTTSYGDSESLGVVFLEAGASGLPVIATRHDGIPEVVLDGKTGLLVDEGDINRMAECMIRLAEDPILAGQLGKAARDRIGSEFNMERSIANLWSIIDAVIH